MKRFIQWVLLASLALGASAWAQTPAQGQGASIVLASTTSTEQSGLFAHLLPAFERETGIAVKVVAVGTGQALDMARRGDADALLVHDLPAEEQFVAQGWSVRRYPVMYNDFVLIGPANDPAGLRGQDIDRAFKRLAAQQLPFISRGDKSGTHMAELRVWARVGLEPQRLGHVLACGCGMGAALNMAQAQQAHVLSDRGTWLAFKNKAGLAVLVQGDERLFNPYGAMVVNPARHPHVQAALAQRWVDWLVSPQGQQRIGSFMVNGQALFFPNAAPTR
jgi:tungstate transport system substrate-binding protein